MDQWPINLMPLEAKPLGGIEFQEHNVCFTGKYVYK